MVYWYDEDDRLFEPTLLVTPKFSEDDYAPVTARYSLVKGLWEPPSIAEAELGGDS
jgi:hypothetical protein